MPINVIFFMIGEISKPYGPGNQSSRFRRLSSDAGVSSSATFQRPAEKAKNPPKSLFLRNLPAGRPVFKRFLKEPPRPEGQGIRPACESADT
jgi:hypothetical protein